MSANAVEQKEKVFDFYLDLLPELRIMVVDEMQPEDRCRFRRCSKSSNKEAKASKNYIYSLSLIACYETIMWISIQHNPQKRNTGLVIKFEGDATMKFMSYSGPNDKELWREELDKSTDLVQYAANHFKELLQQYGKRTKNVVFRGRVLYNKLYSFDFGLGNWKYLKELHIDDAMDNILSQIKRPLKKLTVYSQLDTNDRSLTNCEQLYQVQNELILYQTELSYEQMLRLSTRTLEMGIGNLTEMDIFNFVKAWQNGKLGMDVKCYRWTVSRENFDFVKLFGMFSETHDVERYSLFIRGIKLKNNKDNEKIAKLCQWGGSSPILFFAVKTIQHQGQ